MWEQGRLLFSDIVAQPACRLALGREIRAILEVCAPPLRLTLFCVTKLALLLLNAPRKLAHVRLGAGNGAAAAKYQGAMWRRIHAAARRHSAVRQPAREGGSRRERDEHRHDLVRTEGVCEGK